MIGLKQKIWIETQVSTFFNTTSCSFFPVLKIDPIVKETEVVFFWALEDKGPRVHSEFFKQEVFFETFPQNSPVSLCLLNPLQL